MFIDFATLNNVMPLVIKARFPIMIRAKHGVGKSELVKSYDKKIASILYPNEKDRTEAYGTPDYVYPIVERRASQMADAGDIMGLPFLDDQTTSFRPMKWFYEACIKPCLLFIDEVDRGSQDVRQAFFELTDSRKIAGHNLHKDTIIIACVNGGIGDSSYQVGEMDPAETSRWVIFDAKPSVQDWIDFAKDKVAPQMLDFIKTNNSFLEHTGEFEPSKVYPSRRSWFRLNKCLDGTDLLNISALDEKEKNTEIGVKNETNSMLLYYAALGCVGNETAIAFQDFCKNYKKLVSVEDVIVRGDFSHVKKFEINQHMALIDKFKEHVLFKSELEPKHLENLGRYMFICPPELAMNIWQEITTAFPTNGIAIHGLVLDGKSISDFLARLNGAE